MARHKHLINSLYIKKKGLIYYINQLILRCSFCLLGTLLTTPSPAPVAPHPVTMATYRPPGTPSYSYVPPQWWRVGQREYDTWTPLGNSSDSSLKAYPDLNVVLLCAVLSAGHKTVDMHSHSTPVFFAIGEELPCQCLPPVTLLPA